jgi:hypothetical protein
MTNPTSNNIFGVDSTDVTDALTSLGVTTPATDARLAAHQIVDLLHTKVDAFVAANAPLTSYSVVKEADNIDIDTQRQIFTFTFDMKIAATTVEDEPA